jgi:uncharacterized membrane protein HdeD (DUF308 family)
MFVFFTGETVMATTVREELRQMWWLVLLKGITTLFLGILFITAPGTTLEVMVVFLGVYWLVDGMLSFVEMFVGESDIHWGWLVLKGILGILAGLFVLRHPIYSSVLVPATLVVILGIQGVIMGIIGIIQGIQGDGAPSMILGILHLLFGGILLARPAFGVAAFPFALGALGLVGGIVLIVNAFRLRSL